MLSYDHKSRGNQNALRQSSLQHALWAICCCLSPTIRSKHYHHHPGRVHEAHPEQIGWQHTGQQWGDMFQTQDWIYVTYKRAVIHYGNKRVDKRLSLKTWSSKGNTRTSTPKKNTSEMHTNLTCPALIWMVQNPKKLSGTRRLNSSRRTATMTFLTSSTVQWSQSKIYGLH